MKCHRKCHRQNVIANVTGWLVGHRGVMSLIFRFFSHISVDSRFGSFDAPLAQANSLGHHWAQARQLRHSAEPPES
eukprot:3984795-Pyramimonas_sp.AAC.1